MDYALRQALKKFDARRTEKLGPSESAVFTPDEKGAAMIADVFLPIAKYVIYGGWKTRARVTPAPIWI